MCARAPPPPPSMHMVIAQHPEAVAHQRSRRRVTVPASAAVAVAVAAAAAAHLATRSHGSACYPREQFAMLKSTQAKARALQAKRMRSCGSGVNHRRRFVATRPRAAAAAPAPAPPRADGEQHAGHQARPAAAARIRRRDGGARDPDHLHNASPPGRGPDSSRSGASLFLSPPPPPSGCASALPGRGSTDGLRSL